jgi:tetratricopeptide (TPR) repeat protein
VTLQFVSLGLSTAAAETGKLSASVYLQDQRPAQDLKFTASTNSFALKVLSVEPLDKTRPLLIVVDPASYPRLEMRRRVLSLARALSASAAGRQSFDIRMGILVLDGILGDPIADHTRLVAEFDNLIQHYLPEEAEAQEGDLGRTLDLIAALLERFGADGRPVDCLFVGRDREYESPDSAYLNSGAERRLLEICTRQGTTLYGYLAGTGLLSNICLSAGGMVFGDKQPVDDVIEQVLRGRSHGFMIRLQVPAEVHFSGRFDLAVRAWAGDRQPIDLRAPHAFWRSPDGSAAPDFLHVRQALEWMGRALSARNDGNLTMALRFLRSSIESDSWNPEAFFLAGRTAAEMDDPEGALEYLTRAVRFQLPSEQALLLFCDLAIRRAQPAKALETLKLALSAGVPVTPALRLRTGRLLFGLGRDHEAQIEYAAALASGETSDSARAEYGRVLLRLGDEKRAGEQIQAALSRNPGNVTALICASDIARSRGELPEAMQLALHAAETEPANPDAHAQVGKVKMARQEWEDAARSFNAALAVAPGRRDLLYLLADSQVAAGERGAAARTLRSILAADPSDSQAYQKLARVRVREADLPEAASVLETGAAHAPEHAEALYKAAAGLRERGGEFGQALLDYRAMVASVPESRGASLARKLSQHLAYLGLSVDRDAHQPPPREPDGNPAEVDSARIERSKSGAIAGPEKRKASILVPGGLDLLARTLGIDSSVPRQADALERIFSFILEVTPARSGSNQPDNPLSRNVILGLRNYRSLLRHMERNRLLPAGFDAAKRHEFLFSLSGDEAALARTRALLSFFGMKLGITRSKKNDLTITLSMKDGRKWDERRNLLHNLGVNILDRSLREIRFSTQDEELPAIFDSPTLAAKVIGDRTARSENLLECFMKNYESMKIYMALAACSEATREKLITVLSSADLVSLLNPLSDFARYLEVESGQLRFPGARQAWQEFLGTPGADPNGYLGMLFRRDGGRTLFLYYTLSIAPQSVREYFTASGQRLGQLYSLLLPAGRGLLADPARGTWRADPSRIIRQLSADGRGLFLPVDRRLGGRLFPGGILQDNLLPGSHFSPLPLDPASLGILVQRANDLSPKQSLPVVELVEFLRYFQATHPEPLSDGISAAVATDLAESPVFLDLVWDLDLPQDLMARYLEYCRRLAAMGGSSWNANRTRTSQSLFFLLAAFRREGTLTREGGIELLNRVLARLEAGDEKDFAEGIAAFLSGDLLPRIAERLGGTADSTDQILAALAGRRPEREFSFDGRLMRFDSFGYSLERMKATIQRQNFIPLSQVMDIFELLKEIETASEPTPAQLARLSDSLRRFTAVEFPPYTPARARAMVARADLDSLKKTLDRLPARDPGNRIQVGIPQFIDRLARELHVELGVTLLTYCYAYGGSPEVDALAFDPNLIRKHDFFPATRSSVTGWVPASLETEPNSGLYIAGSLSGLAYALARIETAQSVQGFGRREEPELLPSVLSGLRAVKRNLLSDRAQEYVALSVRLGREILARSVSDPQMFRWCDRQVGFLTSPPRRERVAQEIGRANVPGAAAILSPSELFFLGESYLNAVRTRASVPGSSAAFLPPGRIEENAPPTEGGDGKETATELSAEVPPETDCPNLTRLEELVPWADRSDLAAFRKEVDQYGILLRNRLGLNELSLSISDSYEQLERTLGERLLFERICDLKIRIAEINYSLGLPAFLSELEGQLALRDIIPRSSSVQTNPWRLVLKRISGLEPENVHDWIEELLNRGSLAISARGEAGK